jgi:hypothetical protein
VQVRNCFEPLRVVLNAHGYGFETGPVDEPTLRRVSVDLALPRDFAALYAHGGPADDSSVPWVVEDISLFSFAELPAGQEGYRWTGSQRTPDPAWPTSFVVVASVLGDPFVVDTSATELPVLFARHGAATWSFITIASSMTSFFGGLAEFERVLIGDFDLEVWGDESGLLPAFLDAVERRLRDVWSDEQTSRFIGLLRE